jgi:hypothetical protein
VLDKKEDNAEGRIFAETACQVAMKNSSFTIVDIKNLKEANGNYIYVSYSSNEKSHKFFLKNKAFYYIFFSDFILNKTFINYYNLATGFFVPTHGHKKILELIFGKPCFVLYEAFDPFFKNNYNYFKNKAKNKINICWFGYAESYNNSMSNIINVLNSAFRSNKFSSFNIYTNSISGLNTPNNFNFFKFSKYTMGRNFVRNHYCILSHTPIDGKLNTLYKSPNKLFSTINSNIIPICSCTPSYEVYMKKLGLNDFLFSSPQDLSQILDKIDYSKDFKKLIIAKKRLNLIVREHELKNLSIFKAMFKFKHDTFPEIFLSLTSLGNIFKKGRLYFFRQLKCRISLF